MKKLVIIIILFIIAVALGYFVFYKNQKSGREPGGRERGEEGAARFRGPTSAPYVNGPSGPPPGTSY